jgi:hypothetical protein
MVKPFDEGTTMIHVLGLDGKGKAITAAISIMKILW